MNGLGGMKGDIVCCATVLRACPHIVTVPTLHRSVAAINGGFHISVLSRLAVLLTLSMILASF